MSPLDYDQNAVDASMLSLAELQKKLSSGSQSVREEMLDQARGLVEALQTPSEAVSWVIYAEPARGVATRIALDLKLFETLIAEGGRPKSAEELAKPTSASPILVDRIARCLATMRMIKEVKPSVYQPNSLSEALSDIKYNGGIRFSHDATTLPFAKMPEYLKTTDYENPLGSNRGPWYYAHGQEIFAWLGEHPDLLQAFHAYVYGMQEDRPYWTDEGFYPIQERLISGMEKTGDASAFVDVGGGTGQTLQMFESRVSDWNGRLVLQEIPSVVEIAKALTASERIELSVHDFFEEQPVKGARAYFLRSVLHDWNDENCRRILQRLKEVSKPGYTKILINDCVVADRNADWRHAAVDIYMMALTAAQERTETQWHKLIESAGLKIHGIWSKGAGNESIIEVSV